MTTNATPVAKRGFESYRPAQPLHPIVLQFRSLASMLLRWQRRAMERSQLRDLERHYLDDMGITLSERDVEASKPFWKA